MIITSNTLIPTLLEKRSTNYTKNKQNHKSKCVMLTTDKFDLKEWRRIKVTGMEKIYQEYRKNKQTDGNINFRPSRNTKQLN